MLTLRVHWRLRRWIWWGGIIITITIGIVWIIVIMLIWIVRMGLTIIIVVTTIVVWHRYTIIIILLHRYKLSININNSHIWITIIKRITVIIKIQISPHQPILTRDSCREWRINYWMRGIIVAAGVITMMILIIMMILMIMMSICYNCKGWIRGCYYRRTLR